MNYECVDLEWDTNYFGIKSARVNLYDIIDEQEQRKIIELSKKYDFVTIANHNNINENNYWIGQKTNAFLADINIQFEKKINQMHNYQEKNIYIMNKHPVNELVMNIAKKSFKHSRFFNDPNILETLAGDIYLHWTKNSFKRKDKYFVVHRIKKKVTGYIVFSIDSGYATIELIAVDGKYEGRGIGKGLIRSLESFLMGMEIKKVKVGTQINNIGALQFYNIVGFRYVNCSSIYHVWSK